MSDIKFSLIIPCYNVEEYLPATIQSLSQLKNAENCEFIFINDGSKDSTFSLIDDFAKRDSRVVVIDQCNKGVSAARNAALSIVRGEYLLCVDGDDYLHKDAITFITNKIYDADLLLAPCTTVTLGQEKLQRLSILPGIYSIDEIYKQCKRFPTAPKLVYRSSIIKEHNLRFQENIKCGEVYDFTVSFFEYSKKIAVIEDSFYYYVMRETSAVHKPNYKSDLSVLSILEHFSSLQTTWATTETFIFTALNIVLSFTYNKYMKNGLTDSTTLSELSKVFDNAYFGKLLKSVRIGNLSIKYRIFISYIKFMPFRFGYLVGAYLMKLINRLK